MQVSPERIKQKREALRYSQRGLAIEAGVPYHAVLNLEAGRVKSPSYPNIVAIARVLQEPPEYFFDDVAV